MYLYDYQKNNKKHTYRGFPPCIKISTYSSSLFFNKTKAQRTKDYQEQKGPKKHIQQKPKQERT